MRDAAIGFNEIVGMDAAFAEVEGEAAHMSVVEGGSF